MDSKDEATETLKCLMKDDLIMNIDILKCRISVVLKKLFCILQYLFKQFLQVKTFTARQYPEFQYIAFGKLVHLCFNPQFSYFTISYSRTILKLTQDVISNSGFNS